MRQIVNIGMTRRMDVLGRVVIPKEVRDRMKLTGGTPLEIYLDGNTVILQKYLPLCSICNRSGRIQKFKGVKICRECVKGIWAELK